MDCPLPSEQLEYLRIFITLCQKNPDILHHPELDFFKKYIESLGGVIKGKSDKNATEQQQEEHQTVEEVESGESEVELDYEGVIEADNDPPQTMGSLEKEVSENDLENSDAKKREAIDLYALQKYEDAINAFTEAILLNPTSAVLYAKRGQCFLQLKKPNACIRDCTRAMEINPDNAAAYKFRGRAHRLLGNFVKAAEDLRMACKIDFDEQADEWLKEVTPNARKLEEHQRKYERKKLEKELMATRERVRKMKEQQQQQRKSDDAESPSGNMFNANVMEELAFLMKDQELISGFSDPEIAAAAKDIVRNPANMMKYKDNPKVAAFLLKLNSKMGKGAGGPFAGMNFPSNIFSGAPRADETPKPAADVDLD